MEYIQPYCDKTLGCFDMNGDFGQRLIKASPEDRKTIGTTFQVSSI